MAVLFSLAVIGGITALAYVFPIARAVLVILCVLYDVSHAYIVLTWHAPADAPYRNPPSLTIVIQPLIYGAASIGMHQPVMVKVLCAVLLFVLHLLCFAAVNHGAQKQLNFNAEMRRKTGKVGWFDEDAQLPDKTL